MSSSSWTTRADGFTACPLPSPAFRLRRRSGVRALLNWRRGSRGPFRAALGAGCPAVMVAHVRYRVLDRALPASLSSEVIGGLLRRRLGFSGLVLSDDLEMAAVAGPWGVAGAARRFLAAGGDLALVCQSAEARNEAVAAIGRELDRGVLDLAPAVERRQAARRLIATAGPRPDVSVIGDR